jgi:hypothetical protein
MAVDCIVILTLERHKDGIWIRRLMEELDALLSSRESSDGALATTTVEVRSLERWMGQGFGFGMSSSNDDDPPIFSGVAGIVNRVSDAAPPVLFKACMAILTAARSLGISIVNGPISYSLCANKWCQHVLFQQAGLKAPPTKTFFHTVEQPASLHRDDDGIEKMLLGQKSDEGTSSSVLVKPNSGGFGAGITKMASVPDELPMFEDGVTLLQRYMPPKDGKLYRVWFLEGRVQCAVERILLEDATSDEFTGACAAPTCSNRSTPSLHAHGVPSLVRQEIEEKLLPLLPDAHCGSVEYLFTVSSPGERFYFDLNLLSTLPLQVSNLQSVWEDDYNPWKELAQTILNVLVVA